VPPSIAPASQPAAPSVPAPKLIPSTRVAKEQRQAEMREQPPQRFAVPGSTEMAVRPRAVMQMPAAGSMPSRLQQTARPIRRVVSAVAPASVRSAVPVRSQQASLNPFEDDAANPFDEDE